MHPKYAPHFCLEVAPGPCILVIFGGTGDLARRKLIPSLFQLHTRRLLHETSQIVGSGRTDHSDASFREIVGKALPPNILESEREVFLARFTYVQTDGQDAHLFKRLAQHLACLDNHETPAPFNRLFYFAVPQSVYQPIIAALALAGLLQENPDNEAWCHLLLEKPFGSDDRSAAQLDNFLSQHVLEDQLFRIDHYLGKDTVQNILMLRFANTLFEPVWQSSCIDHVQITVAETLGVEERANYYEQSGLLRDMFQNHLLEMLALVAMEPPATYTAQAIQSEKLAVIRAVRQLPLDALEKCVVRAQYVAGNGLVGYCDEPNVAPDSTTETYVAMKLWVDTPRWQGVPFYLRSGKRLSARNSQITLVFKPSPYTLFGRSSPNSLVLNVQPDEGMCLNLQAKRPGPKLCMGELPLAFKYADLGDELNAPDAYARLLLDAMLHDHTLFVRKETIAAAWDLFTPLLTTWQNKPTRNPLRSYIAGSEGPSEADNLLTSDGRSWLSLMDKFGNASVIA